MVSNRLRFSLNLLVALGLLFASPLGAILTRPAPVQAAAESPARLAPEAAASAAVNLWETTQEGWRLSNPRHLALFSPEGLRFESRVGSVAWTWRLTSASAGEVALANVSLGPVLPTRTTEGVAYARGGLLEQYLARQSSVEQQFILPQPLPLAGSNLVLRGAIESEGAFDATNEGWVWRSGTGAVHLGNVYVYDASGEAVPAQMTVTATETLLVVEGAALARAQYPVTIDPELGTNDFRISYMGRDTSFDAYDAAVAYNSHDDEYLVVWYADSDAGSLVDGEYEIYGQRIRPSDGAMLGSRIRISNMGPIGDPLYDATHPAVAYNSAQNEYLVVWEADDNSGSLVDNEFEIYGQRLSATGSGLGANDFRISDMGSDGDTNFNAHYPAVAYNADYDEYLVVWSGDDDSAGLVNDEYEIWGQRLFSTGAAVGGDFRISDMGGTGNAAYAGTTPAVVYNPTANEYLVVWAGSDNVGGLVAGEYEIFGQRLTPACVQVGTNDFRISDMGGTGDAAFDAADPAVAYNSVDNEYLVVWSADDTTGALVDGEKEIFGQRLTATGAGVGSNDFRISDMGPDGDTVYYAENPKVAFNSLDNQYLVVWEGADNTAPLVAGEREIFGQRLTAAGAGAGANDFRISDMGPNGNNPYQAIHPAVAFSGTANQYLVVWHGDDNIIPLIEGDLEIFGQTLTAAGDEMGTNDFRISFMEPEADAIFDAQAPAVAYNSHDDEYLVVWTGNTNLSGLALGENEIYGQRVDAATGALIGDHIRISHMGVDGDATRAADDPVVAYNSTFNQYLVVWTGDDAIDGENEIYGQRLTSGGVLIGTNFRISDMGPDGDITYDAFSPAIAYNSTDNEYLVVWSGDDNSGSLVEGEYEIFGQRLSGIGAEVGSNDFRISDMGGTGDNLYDANAPAVAYNSHDNQYLVVWYGDDNTGGVVESEFEIFGQLLTAAGTGTGSNDFRISDMGDLGNTNYTAAAPDVAYNSHDNEYLVVWYGEDNTGGLVDNEFEIFGQLLTAAGAGTGSNDFRISDAGGTGSTLYAAYTPSVAYDSVKNEYLVVWYGDENVGGLIDAEYEIFGQRLSSTGAGKGDNDFRISDMGGTGNPTYAATNPAVAYNNLSGEFLVVWWGDDNTGGLVDNEFEIFGQRVGDLSLFLPLVMK